MLGHVLFKQQSSYSLHCKERHIIVVRKSSKLYWILNLTYPFKGLNRYTGEHFTKGRKSIYVQLKGKSSCFLGFALSANVALLPSFMNWGLCNNNVNLDFVIWKGTKIYWAVYKVYMSANLWLQRNFDRECKSSSWMLKVEFLKYLQNECSWITCREIWVGT
jgi:hypothetical protein